MLTQLPMKHCWWPVKGPNWKRLVSLIPSIVQVGKDRFYEVAYVKEFRGGHVGETRFESNQIVVQTGHSNQFTVEIYLHELLHAISDAHDVGLTEKQIMALEQSFYYMLKPGNVFKNE